jgi:DNA-binding transcriptional ArsR family regulator
MRNIAPIGDRCTSHIRKTMSEMDRNLARAFCMTADTGSLSAAARKLGLTQPTLSRQVADFEAALGVTLFERVGKKLVPTEAGLVFSNMPGRCRPLPRRWH